MYDDDMNNFIIIIYALGKSITWTIILVGIVPHNFNLNKFKKYWNYTVLITKNMFLSQKCNNHLSISRKFANYFDIKNSWHSQF